MWRHEPEEVGKGQILEGFIECVDMEPLKDCMKSKDVVGLAFEEGLRDSVEMDCRVGRPNGRLLDQVSGGQRETVLRQEGETDLKTLE